MIKLDLFKESIIIYVAIDETKMAKMVLTKSKILNSSFNCHVVP